MAVDEYGLYKGGIGRRLWLSDMYLVPSDISAEQLPVSSHRSDALIVLSQIIQRIKLIRKGAARFYLRLNNKR